MKIYFNEECPKCGSDDVITSHNSDGSTYGDSTFEENMDQLKKEIDNDIEEIEKSIDEFEKREIPDLDSENFLDFAWKYLMENLPLPYMEDDLMYSVFGFQLGDIITLENGAETLLLNQLGNFFLTTDIDENEIPNGVLHIIKAHWEQEGTYIYVLDTKTLF